MDAQPASERRIAKLVGLPEGKRRGSRVVLFRAANPSESAERGAEHVAQRSGARERGQALPPRVRGKDRPPAAPGETLPPAGTEHEERGKRGQTGRRLGETGRQGGAVLGMSLAGAGIKRRGRRILPDRKGTFQADKTFNREGTAALSPADAVS